MFVAEIALKHRKFSEIMNARFPVIWFGDRAISCNVIRRALHSTVDVPIVWKEVNGRRIQTTGSAGTLMVAVSNGISLVFKVTPRVDKQILWDDTHLHSGTFMMTLRRIQVTAIPRITENA